MIDQDEVHPHDLAAFRAAFQDALEMGSYNHPVDVAMTAYKGSREARLLHERFSGEPL